MPQSRPTAQEVIHFSNWLLPALTAHPREELELLVVVIGTYSSAMNRSTVYTFDVLIELCCLFLNSNHSSVYSERFVEFTVCKCHLHIRSFSILNSKFKQCKLCSNTILHKSKIPKHTIYRKTKTSSTPKWIIVYSLA